MHCKTRSTGLARLEVSITNLNPSDGQVFVANIELNNDSAMKFIKILLSTAKPV